MITSLTHLKTSAVALAAALSVATIPAAPAHAWGDKEQGSSPGSPLRSSLTRS